MVPLTGADEALFGAVVMAARFGRVRPIVEHLSTHYEQARDDPLAGYPYALSMLAGLQSDERDLREWFDYSEIIETLGDLLYHEPDHWLGRFLRIHARLLLPMDLVEHRHYVQAERARAAEDAAELIERQTRTAWQPWFACAYLLAARLAWESDGADRARVSALVSTAAVLPGEPIRFRALGSLLCDAFLWYYGQPDTPERETVGTMMDTLFPDQPRVRWARPVRST